MANLGKIRKTVLPHAHERQYQDFHISFHFLLVQELVCYRNSVCAARMVHYSCYATERIVLWCEGIQQILRICGKILKRDSLVCPGFLYSGHRVFLLCSLIALFKILVKATL